MAFRIPHIGDKIPRKGGFITRFIGKTGLRLWGWRIEGEIPNNSKFVHLVAPHTSNWDFPVGVLAQMAMNLDIRFMGKEALFEGLQGKLMRALGGIPVSLQRGLGMTDTLAEEIRNSDGYILTITPEGSRFLRTTWRTGYYYIAHKAKLPILLVYMDFKEKVIGYGPTVIPSGDFNKDVHLVNAYFKGRSAYQPEWYRLHETVHPITNPDSPELLPGFSQENYVPNHDNPSGRLPEIDHLN